MKVELALVLTALGLVSMNIWLLAVASVLSGSILIDTYQHDFPGDKVEITDWWVFLAGVCALPLVLWLTTITAKSSYLTWRVKP